MNLLSIVLAALLLQNATVDGTLTKLGMTEPVPKATIELRAADDDAVHYTVTSRDDGRFTFRDVKPGRYRLAASRSGFVRMEYGQRKTSGRGNPIEVAAGQNVANLRLSMTPTGSIYGRVYDMTGQPVVKAAVQALKTGYANGRRTFTVQQSTVTNDLGEYRLFWLTPGQYYVGAVMPDWNRLGDIIMVNGSAPPTPGNAVMGSIFSSPIVNPVGPSRFPFGTNADTARYQTVYFPNTTEEDAAKAIELAPASNLGGIDILLSPVRTRRVKGVVFDGETGQPAKSGPGANVQVSISPGTQGASTPFANPAGEFDIQVLQAPTVLTASSGLRSGRVSIPFGDTDINDMRIVLTPGFTLAGQLAVDEGQAAGLRVVLRNEPSTIFTPAPPQTSGVPGANGNFTVQNVFPGDYRINVTPILNPGAATVPVPAAMQKWYVKSIRFADTDVLNDLLHIDAAPRNPLIVVIGTNAGALSGTVLNAKQEPAPECTVALVPANRGRLDLYKFVIGDASGNFKIDNIAPGDYKMFAWEDVVTGAWTDPQFMKPYEERGTAIRIIEGGKMEVRLSLIP